MEIFYAILAILLLLIVVKFVYKRISIYNDVLYKKDENNEVHIVAKGPNAQQSVALLKEIKLNLTKLIYHCVQRGKNEKVLILKERFDVKNIQEASTLESGTSFTVNKGEKLHICLRDKKDNLKHHELNLLMFVAIHELAHIMSVDYGHKEEFNRNFKFLLKNAVQLRIYKPVNYSETPVTYCGIQVNTSPLF